MNKTELQRRISAGLGCEVFNHEHLGMFNVTTARQRAARGLYGPPRTMSLFPELGEIIAYLRAHRDWEHGRIWDLLVDPAAPWLHDPVILLYLGEEGSFCLIDGIHRLLAGWIVRMPTFQSYVIPIDEAPRVSEALLRSSVDIDWGRLELRADGKYYDRNTGQLVTSDGGTQAKATVLTDAPLGAR